MNIVYNFVLFLFLFIIYLNVNNIFDELLVVCKFSTQLILQGSKWFKTKRLTKTIVLSPFSLSFLKTMATNARQKRRSECM